MGMSTASLQASCASASHASNQVPDGILGKIVPFFLQCCTILSMSSSWIGSMRSRYVTWSSWPVLGQCTFLLCHWSKQLVIDCHWSNTLESYCIQIWYIFMHRILFGDLLKLYKFLFWLSVYNGRKKELIRGSFKKFCLHCHISTIACIRLLKCYLQNGICSYWDASR